jgi:FkbM family methyltransferase
MQVYNFTVIESEYGKFIVNRHCAYQAESLIKTGRPHIQGELNNILAIVGLLPENCIVVDAGANIGLVAVPIAHAVRARRGLVHAFEVQRMMSYALCGAAALNDLENLIVHCQALGAAVGEIGIARPDYSQPQDFGTFSLLDNVGPSVDRIAVVTIDSLDLPRLDFLKIDVEGMEIDVLKGARQSVQRSEPWVWVEYWKVDREEIKAQFAGLEYKFYLIDPLNMLCVPSARVSTAMGRQVVIDAPEA